MAESNHGDTARSGVSGISVFRFTNAARRGLKIWISATSLMVLALLSFFLREENGTQQVIMAAIGLAMSGVIYSNVQSLRRSQQVIECSSAALSEKRGGVLVRQIPWKGITKVQSLLARPNPVLILRGAAPSESIAVDFGIGNMRELLREVADYTRGSLLLAPLPIVLGRRPGRRFLVGCSKLALPWFALGMLLKFFGFDGGAVVALWVAGGFFALLSAGFVLGVREVVIGEDLIRIRRLRGVEEIHTRDIAEVVIELISQPVFRPIVSVVLRDGSTRELSYFNVEAIPLCNSLRTLKVANTSATQ